MKLFSKERGIIEASTVVLLLASEYSLFPHLSCISGRLLLVLSHCLRFGERRERLRRLHIKGRLPLLNRDSRAAAILVARRSRGDILLVGGCCCC